MRRAVIGSTLATLAVAALTQGCGPRSAPAPPTTPGTPDPAVTSEPSEPSATPPAASGAPPAAAPSGEQHTIRVTASGPHDTVLRVARGGYYTRVDLRGEPFDFTFTEPEGGGYRDISVWAGTEHPEQAAVRCAIEVDGKVVARRSADRPDAEGKASVVCEIPEPT